MKFRIQSFAPKQSRAKQIFRFSILYVLSERIESRIQIRAETGESNRFQETVNKEENRQSDFLRGLIIRGLGNNNGLFQL